MMKLPLLSVGLAFAREVERVLPVEKPYACHRHLETVPVLGKLFPSKPRAKD